ncbi:hypothetical protein NX059_005357 [Plenodomus lindquistii]|nr:hypothetical protein NX059_005357 [Plenodomus lindquistii]
MCLTTITLRRPTTSQKSWKRKSLLLPLTLHTPRYCGRTNPPTPPPFPPHNMSSNNSSAATSSSDTTKPSPSTTTKPTTSIFSTLTSFTLLYVTTLFSLDSWAAARASPHRAPSNDAHYRPAPSAPAPGSYQAGMHGRGSAGPRDPDEERRRRGGRDVGVVDSRPPLGMGGSAACGACLI